MNHQLKINREEEVDLAELFSALWQGKWLIVAVTAVFAVIAIIFALSLPNIYRSEVLLAPASSAQKSGLGGLAGQFGGLASLAGLNLGATGMDKTILGLEIIKSRDFISRFIEQQKVLVPLMAAKDWDQRTNALILDEDIYKEGQWVRDVEFPKQAEPSLQEAYEEFIELLTVTQNKENGMVVVGIEHVSPYIARQWLTELVAQLNNYMRQRDMAEAKMSLVHLEAELAKTQVEELRQALYQLIEEQTKTLMLTQVGDEYVFKTVDAAIVPEQKAKPSRALICIVFCLFGGFLGSLVVLVRFFINSGKNNTTAQD